MDKLEFKGAWNDLKGKLKKNMLNLVTTTLLILRDSKISYWVNCKKNSVKAGMN